MDTAVSPIGVPCLSFVSLMFHLDIRQRDQDPINFEGIHTPLFVGRDQTMDLVLDDPLVSRQHAVITSKGDDFIIQDVGGRNPLRVNSRVVVRHVLSDGDEIILGGAQIRFWGRSTKKNGTKGSTAKVSANGQASSIAGAEPVDTDSESSSGAGSVVDARETLQHFRDSPELLSSEDTMSGSVVEEIVDTNLPPSQPQRNLRILRNFSELIRNLSDRQKLLESALHSVFDTLDARCGLIGFFGPSGQLEVCVQRMPVGAPSGSAGDRIAPVSYSPTIVDRVRREGIAILFGDDQESAAGPRDETLRAGLDSRSLKQLRIKSAMCFPLFRADEVCGILYIDDRGRKGRFSQDDLYFANILSNLISLAVEKEALYERIHDENLELRSILSQKNRLIGVSSALKKVQRKVKRVAAFDTTVLIMGESGTGKELVARAIHDRSPRRSKPFIAVNCAAIPETLLESELFGYARQSGISGSDPKGKPGKFEQADGGTIFLDEIGDMSLSTQAKILRVLEDRVVDRLGGVAGRRVDLRIIAATNKVLGEAVNEGQFREDLYYRLKVFQVDLPALRERREDILPLAQHFLSMLELGGRAADERGPIELSPRAKELLLAYHWPGNIRELKHGIEEAVLLSNGRTIYPENLSRDLRRDDNPQPFGTLSEVEAQHIRRVLQSVNWNERRASEMLGINRSTLYEKIRLYQIEKPGESAGAKRTRAASKSGAASRSGAGSKSGTRARAKSGPETGSGPQQN